MEAKYTIGLAGRHGAEEWVQVARRECDAAGWVRTRWSQHLSEEPVMSTTPGTEPSSDDGSQPVRPSPVDHPEASEDGAAGIEIGMSEDEGSTFEPEEDPEAQR